MKDINGYIQNINYKFDLKYKYQNPFFFEYYQFFQKCSQIKFLIFL